MESASSRVIATNGAALRIAEGGTGEPALVFLHYWGGSPICRSRGGGMMSVAVPLDRLDERGESRKETEESQATGWRLSTRGFLLSTFSPLFAVGKSRRRDLNCGNGPVEGTSCLVTMSGST